MSKQAQANVKLSGAPIQSVSQTPAGLLQRKCACGGSVGLTEDCQKNNLTLQTEAPSDYETQTAPQIVHDVLQTPGQPLDVKTRTFFESSLGHNFNQVRVHADTKAAESATSVDAIAYTVGNHIVLNRQFYSPHTITGYGLIAHELTHVMQQDSFIQDGTIKIGQPDDKAEKEAATNESLLYNGQELERSLVGSDVGLRRQESPPQRHWGAFQIESWREEERTGSDDNFVRDVRSDLNQINLTPLGQRLLRAIFDSRSRGGRRPIQIREDDLTATNFGPEYYDWLQLLGVITPPLIRYRRSNEPLTPCSNSTDNSWMSSPRYVFLFHELVHIYDSLIERREVNECMTTGLGSYFLERPFSENKLRCELGLPIRPCYANECFSHAPPTCSQATQSTTGHQGPSQPILRRQRRRPDALRQSPNPRQRQRRRWRPARTTSELVLQFLQPDSPIWRQLNPNPDARINCPATAAAVDHYLRTGEIIPAESGDATSTFNISREPWSDPTNDFEIIEQLLSRRNSFVVIEATRSSDYSEQNRITPQHYFIAVRVEGRVMVIDAYGHGEAIRNVPNFLRDEGFAQFRYYRGAFQVTHLRLDLSDSADPLAGIDN